LYESITGMTPFDGENYNALMRAIVEDEPSPLPLENGVDQRLRELVGWGLAKDREQRPGSIQELARALAEWLIERGINEDITFAPLGQKWLMRPGQKSVPLVPTDEGGDEAPLAPRTDTLVSPGLPARLVEHSSSRLKSGQAPPRAVRALPVRARKRVQPAVALVLALLGAGVAWALLRSPARPVVVVPAPPRSVAVATIAPAPTARVELAPTPPQPSAAEPVSNARSGRSASPATSAARSSNPGVPKLAHSSVGPSTATKPTTPDGHDETRELLQAY
jgi:serine/threonine protein kinase